jgi:hypothetical protein
VTAESADCEVQLEGFDSYRAAPDVLLLHTPVSCRLLEAILHSTAL